MPWYEARPEARARAIARCRDSSELANGWACRNAETAEDRVYRKRLERTVPTRLHEGDIYKRHYWHNPREPMRLTMLQLACRPGAAPSYTSRFCRFL